MIPVGLEMEKDLQWDTITLLAFQVNMCSATGCIHKYLCLHHIERYVGSHTHHL